MNYEYSYENEVKILRNLFSREGEHPFAYSDATSKQIQCIVISMETFLIKHGYKQRDERRELRLAMLSDIMGREITTTNDLSAYQCSVIISQLLRDEYGRPDDKVAERFFEDCKDKVEGTDLSRKIRDSSDQRKTAKDTEVRILRELGF